MRFMAVPLLASLAALATLAQTPTLQPRVRLETSYGPILVELDPGAAPKTVANFLTYVTEGFYTETLFHRVIPGFMIQGGGYGTDLAEKSTHPPVVNESESSSKAGLLNKRGTLAMARTSQPDSAAAQFFINLVDNPALDFHNRTPEGIGYCVFGKVVEGMEVVDRIAKVITVTRRGMQNIPEYPVKLQSASLIPETRPAGNP